MLCIKFPKAAQHITDAVPTPFLDFCCVHQTCQVFMIGWANFSHEIIDVGSKRFRGSSVNCNWHEVSCILVQKRHAVQQSMKLRVEASVQE